MKKTFQDPIDLGQRKTGTISSLLDKYMEKFTVHQSPHLFDMNDNSNVIIGGNCPVCLCKWKMSMKGDIRCNSKRHKQITKKGFFIPSKSVLKSYPQLSKKLS